MAKKKPPTHEHTKIEAPEGAERFVAIIRAGEENNYPYLSIHELGGANYRVVAMMSHPDGVAVEFVRVL